jgi:hypothetical protein
MFLSLSKPTIALGAAFVTVLSLGLASPAEAAPPPGMRWSDTVGLTSPRTPLRPTRVAPSYAVPAVVVTSVPAAPTIAIRGPDGVVRTYPVEGGVVQQGATTAFVSVRGPDGVVRMYPVASSSGVVTYPCR